MKPTVESLLTDCQNLLTNSKAQMMERLRPFATRGPEENLLFACFELFHMQDYSMNWNTFLKDKNSSGKNIINCEFNDHSGGDPVSVIPELNDYLAKTFNGSFELTQAEGVDFTRRHEEQLIAWFKECWYEVGGKTSKIPTYFSLDKEYILRDIETGEIIEENEAAEKLGYIV